MQALTGLFRTPTRLHTPTAVSHRNKRTRSRASLSSSTPSTPSTPSLPAVVLQTYSVSTDSIVLTALPSVPFCCHEDLLTMSRPQLEGVVRALNARLPSRMRIGPEDDFWNDARDSSGGRDEDNDGLSRMSEAELKRRIEELVGIRAIVGKNRVSRSGLGLGARSGVPPAPKAVRTRESTWRPCEKMPWEMEVDGAEDRSDDSSVLIEDSLMGSSPLAGRTKTGFHVRGRNNALPPLDILREESEGGESKEEESGDDEARPSKRQRISSGSVNRDFEEGTNTAQEARRESRLIESMDVSGSLLLTRDDDTALENIFECDDGAVMIATNLDRATKTPEEESQVPPQRRSARIKEIALKRTLSVDSGKKAASHSRDSKSSFLCSKAFSSLRSSGNTPRPLGESNTGRDSGTPREMTIRLPFASTPPHRKPDSSTWSAPRILRSHSQRLSNLGQSAKTKSALGRSQSERYPRPSDMAFVTIDRPRYRFTRRKAKATKVSKGDQSSRPSVSASPQHVACQPQVVQISRGYTHGKHEDEKENEDPKVATKGSALGPHSLPSALCSILASRSRAPSTSTVASGRGNCGDSPVRAMVTQGIASTVTTDSAASNGATEQVWEALGRMAVNSV